VNNSLTEKITFCALVECDQCHNGGKYIEACTLSCGGGARAINACCKKNGYTQGCCSGTDSSGAGDAYCV